MAATARQLLIADILTKTKDPSRAVAYVATGPLNAALDTAGIVHVVAKDGLSEVPGGQTPDVIACAIESAIFNAQPQLAKAIFVAEQQRAVAQLQAQSSSYNIAKSATDASTTATQGVTFP